MAQVTKAMCEHIIAAAARHEYFPLTPNEMRQLAYLAMQAIASAATVGEASVDASFVGGAQPTHYCKVCNALWRRWDDGSWNLRSKQCGKCCDNVAMGDQIVPMTYDGARVTDGSAQKFAEALRPLAAQQQAEPSGKLDAPAQVGNTVFGKGVKTRLVIEAAQRNHQRTHNPTEEDKRITAATESIARLRKQIEQEHDAKSPFQREVERLGKPQAEPAADEPLEPNGRLRFEGWVRDFFKPATGDRCEKYESGDFKNTYKEPLTAILLECWLAAQSGQRAGVAEEWQLVPKEPTHAMHLAGETQWENSGNASPEISAIYRAMLAAAPTQQQEGGK